MKEALPCLIMLLLSALGGIGSAVGIIGIHDTELRNRLCSRELQQPAYFEDAIVSCLPLSVKL